MRRTLEPTWLVLNAFAISMLFAVQSFAFKSMTEPNINVDNVDISERYVKNKRSYAYLPLLSKSTYINTTAEYGDADISVNSMDMSAIETSHNAFNNSFSKSKYLFPEANIFIKRGNKISHNLSLLTLTSLECDSLIFRTKINISIGNNCQTKILPEYFFVGSGFMPNSADILRYEYIDTSGTIRTDSIIPSYFVGTCLDVTAFVDGCDTLGYTTKFCIEDKDPPNITCAPNDTISCLEASQRIFTGFIADCGDVDTLLLDEDIEELSSGPFIQKIKRIWQLRDAIGNLSDTCSQTILVNRLDFVNQLMLPQDTTLSCDIVGGINVIIDPAVSGQVKIEGIPISTQTKLCNTAAFYNDQILIKSPCKQVTLRTWTINEWRNGRDNIFERRQMITVIDTVAPTISGLPDTMRVATSSNICSADVDLPAITFSETCNEASVKVDMFTPSGAFLDKNGGIVNLRVDTNHIFYVIKDICHNQVRDTLVVIVTDATAPLTLCESEIVVVIPSQSGNIDVPADNFDIHSVDACGGPVTKMVRHMDSTTFANQINFDCDNIGDTIMIMLQVSDALGNAATCMISTLIQGDTATCVSNSALVNDAPLGLSHNVSGLVFTYQSIGIPGVSISNSNGEYSETDQYGNYEFGQLKANVNYEIMAELESDYWLGVSTLDLIKIQRHIIGLEPLDNKYREMAGDINHDGSINALDLVMLRKHILGFETLDYDSWRFVSDNSEKVTTEAYVIESLSQDTEVDFVGIKMGDVTGDAVHDLLTDTRSINEKVLAYDIIDLGGYREISIKATEKMSLSGLQISMQYNSEILSFANISGAQVGLESNNYNTSKLGNIYISWASNEDITVQEGDVLWRVLLVSQSGNEWNYDLKFSSKGSYFHSEGYDNDETFGLVLERAKTPSEEFSDVQNDPNPWSERTILSFDLPRGGMVELELFDAQNRLVLDRTKLFDAGSQNWIITGKELGQGGGVYFGKMSFEGKTRVFKMIKID
ncbi:MAG: dockerin type I domain-containing protein [Saprospiraceae bacterium]